MAFFSQRQLVIVGASTAVGFIGDVLTYSVAASKGSSFKIVVPKGKELFNVIALGVVSGFILDYALKFVEDSLKNKEEKELDKLVEVEREKIYSGLIKDKTPKSVIWA